MNDKRIASWTSIGITMGRPNIGYPVVTRSWLGKVGATALNLK